MLRRLISKKRKGVTLGTTIAMILIVTIATFSIAKIYETYAEAYKSISEYAEVSEKPVFEISGMVTTDTALVITLTNKGPTSATVKRVMLFKYTNGSVPSEVQVETINKYVPVGKSFEVTIPIDIADEFMTFERPLRIVVETDKGLSSIGTTPPTSQLTVNVILPDYITDNDGELYLHIPCGALDYVRVLPPQSSTRGVSIVRHGNTISVTTPVYTIGECTVELTGRLKLRALASDWQNTKVIDESQHNIEPKLGGVTIVNKRIDMEASIGTIPASASTIEFKIPSVVTQQTKDPTLSEKGIVRSQTIDFSWYFTRLTSETFAYSPSPYDIAKELVKENIIIVNSPAGFKVYPSTTDTNPPSNIMRLFKEYSLSPRHKTWSGTYVHHSGVPIVVDKPRASNKPILEVLIPFKLERGNYLIIPVFSYDDDDKMNCMPTRITVSIIKPDGSESPDADIIEEQEAKTKGSPFEVVSMLKLKATQSGEYILKISIKASRSNSRYCRWTGGSGRADYSVLVLSKVVILKIPDLKLSTAFTTTNIPTFPFAVVDMQSGDISRLGKIYFAVGERTPGGVTQAVNKRPNLAIQPGREFTFDSSGAYVGSRWTRRYHITNVRRAYCSPGFSLRITPIGWRRENTFEVLQYDEHGHFIQDYIPYSYELDGIISYYKVGIALITPLSRQDTGFRIYINAPPGSYDVYIGLVGYASPYFTKPPYVIINGYDRRDFALSDYRRVATLEVHYVTNGNSYVDVHAGEFNSESDAQMIGISYIIVTKHLRRGADYKVGVGEVSSHGTGILLKHVKPFTSIIRAYLYDSNGALLGSWTFSKNECGDECNVLLSISEFGDRDTRYRKIIEEEPYSLVVYGAIVKRD